jgi:hypothetical protein
LKKKAGINLTLKKINKTRKAHQKRKGKQKNEKRNLGQEKKKERIRGVMKETVVID